MEKTLMAQSVIGALRVNLGLDSAQFERGAKRAQTTTQRLGSSLQRFGAAMSLVSAGIVAAFRSQINAADEAGKAAQKVGLSVEALTRLRFAADLSGVSAQQLETGIQRLSRTMVSGSKAFDRVGVASRDAAGRLRPTEDVLLDLADVFQRMPDGAEKTALAIETLGRSGADLIPLLNGGSAALRAMMNEADALGLTISNDTFRAAERFNDALTRIGAVARGLTRQIAAELAPAMAAIAETIADTARAFTSLAPEVRTTVAVTVALAAAVGPLALALGTLIKSAGLLKVGLAAIFSPAGLAVAGIAVVAVLAAQVVRLVKELGGWAEALDAVKEVSAEVFERIGFGVEALKSTFRAAGESIKSALVGAFAGALQGFSDLTQGIADGWNGLMRSIGVESLATAQAIGGDLASSLRLTADLAESNARISNDAAGAWRNAATQPLASLNRLRRTMEETEDATTGAVDAAGELADTLEEVAGAGGRGGRGGALANIAEDAEQTTMAFGPLEAAVGTFSDTIGDLFSGGIATFRDFADTMLRGFQRLLADMVSLAVRNRITVGIGAGAAGAGTAAAAGTGGGLLSGIQGIAGALGPLGIAAAIGGGGLLAAFGARRRRRQRAAAEREAAAQERGGLEVELLRATGDTAELRRRELDALRPANRALAERLFALQDEQRIGAERATLEGQLLQLQGDIAELRRREIAALDPANRSLAERIFLMQDEVRIGDERRGLEERLLRLQGDTEELRRREIEALDETNRGLLRQIFALEDMAETMDRIRSRLSGSFDLSQIEFGSSFEQRLSQVAEARGYESIAGVPARNLLPGNDPQLSNMENLLKRSSDTLDAILFNGIPVRA
jgi:hypothetical protein